MLNLLNVDSLVNHLLRPPKFTYSIVDLGCCIFSHNNIMYERIDFHVQNRDNMKIYASLWRKKVLTQNRLATQNRNDRSEGEQNFYTDQNIKKESHKKSQNKNNGSVMIYLHCNCGCRVESMQLVNRALELGYIFVAFDSRGCGHSQGQYISLGYHQIWDLEAVIAHIHENYIVNPQIVLWGRSMGAVTVMNYLINSTKYIKNVKVAVLDSPFLNLNQVICQIVNKKIGVPKLLIDMFLGYIQPLVQQKVGFKISQFDLREQVCKIQCPLILMASKSDGLVPFKHLQQIYDSHHGRKSIFYLSESHTDQRTSQTISKIFKAITRYFIPQKNPPQPQQSGQPIPKSPPTPKSANLLTCRSSQFTSTSTKKPACKKIELTYPYSSSKSQMYTQLSIEKTGQQKKKKLSLHHSKSINTKEKSINKSGGGVRATIHLYSKNQNQGKGRALEKVEKLERGQEEKYTAGALLRRISQEDGHRRLVSNFYHGVQLDKENVCTRRFTAWEDTGNQVKLAKVQSLRPNHRQ